MRRALHLLGRHHTKPIYKMAWRQSKGAWNTWGRESQNKNTGKGKPKKSGQSQEGGQGYVGYDGKRVTLPCSQQSQASSKEASQHGKLERQMETIKAMLSQMATSGSIVIPEGVKELLQDSPGKDLRERQRELNEERRQMQKVKSLQQQIQKEKEAYANWLQYQKDMMRVESKRHEDKLEELQERLKQAKEGPMVAQAMEEDSEVELLADVAEKARTEELQKMSQQNHELMENQATMMQQITQLATQMQSAAQEAMQKDAEIQQLKTLLGHHQTNEATKTMVAPSAMSPQRPIMPQPFQKRPEGVEAAKEILKMTHKQEEKGAAVRERSERRKADPPQKVTPKSNEGESASSPRRRKEEKSVPSKDGKSKVG